MSLIEKMLEEIHHLEHEITSCTTIESCFPVQKRFTAVVKEAMDAYKAGRIQVDVKALPLPMYFWATEELPEKIKNPENVDDIRKQLLLFKNTILFILNPKEELD
jgi:hypothetical protein